VCLHADLLPADIPDLQCCGPAILDGPRHCECWTPVYDREQSCVLRADLLPMPALPPRMCHDCAYRPGSPERQGDEGFQCSEPGELDDLATQPIRQVYEAVEIPLHDRHRQVVAVAVIDLGAAAHAAKAWYLGKNGYVMRVERITPGRNGKRRVLYLHREVLGLKPGDPGVDHEDGDPLNCRRYNLRVGRQRLNLQNRGPNRGHPWARGVSFDAARGKWTARVKINGKKHDLGRYDDPETAAAVASAFRAANMPWSADARALEGGRPFYCHQDVRRAVALVHGPTGSRFDLTHLGDYRPPQARNDAASGHWVPYKADGTPADICSGWFLRRQAWLRYCEREAG
jgi:hypothetical protein